VPFRPLGRLTPIAEATGGAASAVVFGLASAVRGRRIFHPVGDAYEARLTVDGPVVTAVPLLAEPVTRPCVVRLSRGLGLRPSLPDILGLAVRALDLEQDLLLVTSVARHLIVPAGAVDARRYSTILPYRAGDRTVVVGALPLGGDAFGIELADVPRGAWSHVATLRLGERLAPEASEGLRFNPVNAGGGLEPVGVVQSLRRLAYAGSQAGRPTPVR
jgi:hypothetical protein